MTSGIQVTGKTTPEAAEILTPEALAFVADLAREFEHTRRTLMQARAARQEEIDAGGNGGNELRNWLSAAALAGDSRARVLCYRPEPCWFLGVTALEWPVGPAL